MDRIHAVRAWDNMLAIGWAVEREALIAVAVSVEEAAELDVCSLALIARVASALRREASNYGGES